MPYTVPKLTDYSAAALELSATECVDACKLEAEAVHTDLELKAFRDRWMARKNGILTQINDLWLKGAPKEAKREAGIRVNELKARITELVEGARVAGRCRMIRSRQSASTFPFPACAVRLAQSIPSSKLGMKLSPSSRSSVTPSPKVRWLRRITTTSKR